MIRFRCAKCGKPLAVKDELAGKVGSCPVCKNKIKIPATVPATAPEFVEGSEKNLSSDAVPELVDKPPAPPPLPPSPPSPPVLKEAIQEEPPRRRRPADDWDDEEEERPRRRRRSREEDDWDEEEPEERPRPRRKKKKKKKKKKRSSSADGPSGFVIAMIALPVLALILIGAGIAMPRLLLAPLILGWVTALIGWIWFLMVAFQDDALQGVLCFIVPLYALYYLITHFEETKHAFFIYLLGFGIIMVSGCAGAAFAPKDDFGDSPFGAVRPIVVEVRRA